MRLASQITLPPVTAASVPMRDVFREPVIRNARHDVVMEEIVPDQVS
jgi:hypothetical protein